MKTKHIISALLAMTGLAFGTQAYGVTAALPDLIVGFQNGGPTDYELDLGSMTNYASLAPNSVVNLSGYLSATDLSSTFGSSWFADGSTSWGAAATVGNPSVNPGLAAAKTVWVTQFDTVSNGLFAPNVGSLPASSYASAINTTANNRYNGISSLTTLGGGINGAVSSTNTAMANTAALVSAGNANSWTGQVDLASGNVFKGFSGAIDTGTALSLTTGQYEVLDLFQYAGLSPSGQSGTYIGSLELGANGSLFFLSAATTAVPEPATYAALIGVAALGIAMLRRKQATV